MRRSSLAALACISVAFDSVVATLTSSELSSVFPSNTNGSLSGSTRSLSGLDISVITNATVGLWVLNSTKTEVEKLGWMASGLGNKMANADFLIAWPTISGSSVSWTLSHRLPGGGSHSDPRMAATSASTTTTAFYTIVPELTTTTTGSPYTTVAWTRLLTVPADYPTSSAVTSPNVDPATTSLKMIYASASKDPSSSADNADVPQHNNAFGSFSMDVSQPINLASNDPVSGNAKSTGWTSRDKALIAHAVIGSVAVVLTVPAGIWLARFGRNHSWFPAHRAIQFVSVLFIVVAAIIGITQTQAPHFSDDHTRLGIILLAVFIVQPLLGIWGHHTKAGSPLTSAYPSFARPFPSIVRILHILLGIVAAGLGYWQVNSGFDEWQSSSDRQSNVPIAVKVVFWILLVLGVVGYLAGWVRGIVMSRKRTSSDDVHSSDSNLVMTDRRGLKTARTMDS